MIYLHIGWESPAAPLLVQPVRYTPRLEIYASLSTKDDMKREEFLLGWA